MTTDPCTMKWFQRTADGMSAVDRRVLDVDGTLCAAHVELAADALVKSGAMNASDAMHLFVGSAFPGVVEVAVGQHASIASISGQSGMGLSLGRVVLCVPVAMVAGGVALREVLECAGPGDLVGIYGFDLPRKALERALARAWDALDRDLAQSRGAAAEKVGRIVFMHVQHNIIPLVYCLDRLDRSEGSYGNAQAAAIAGLRERRVPAVSWPMGLQICVTDAGAAHA